MKLALHEWLNLTFNDYYSVHDGMGLFKIICHKPEYPNENFYGLLDTIYDLSEAEYKAEEKEFVIRTDYNVLTISPYDNQIHHTMFITRKVS